MRQYRNTSSLGVIRSVVGMTVLVCFHILLHSVSVCQGAVGLGDSSGFFLNTNIQAEETHLTGYIRDSLNEKAINNCTVSLIGNGFNVAVSTNSQGFYTFYNIGQTEPWANYSISVSHNGGGYEEIIDEMVSLELGLPNEVDKHLETRTVVLLHGILSSGGTWEDPMDGAEVSFKGYLESEPGFKVINPSFPDPNASILINSEFLNLTLDNVLHDQGIQSYSIVAHSAGGLVARTFIATTFSASRVKNLITLGTPHHGSPLAILAMRYAWWADYLFGDPAPIGAELVPGSVALDLLNYAVINKPWEEFACLPHDPESRWGLAADRIYSIAGTNPDGWHYTGAMAMWQFGCFSGDGIVPTKSARFWASDNFCTDVDLGCEVEHKARGSVHFTQNAVIAEAVKNILQGNSPECSGETRRESGKDEMNYQLLPVISAIIEPGETYQDSSVINALNEANFSCLWGGDPLGFTLVTPSGVEINPQYADTSSSVTFFSDSISATYSIAAPEHGTWGQTVLAGADAVTDTVLIMVSVDTNVLFDVSATSTIQPDGSFLCRATFLDGGFPCPNATVEMAVSLPDETEDVLPLFDDGVYPDETASDGVFAAEYPASGLAGAFSFTFTGIVDTGNPDSEEFQSFAASTAAYLPDMAIEPEDLVIGDAADNHGFITYLDEIQVSATFQNAGEAQVDSVRLIVENMNFGVAVIDTVVSFVSGAIVDVQTEWMVASQDTTWFRANAVVLGEIPDSDIVNNSTVQWVRALLPGEPTSVPDWEGDSPDGDGSSPPGLSVSLFQNSPNPFNPKTEIKFTVTHDQAMVELRIFDIAGRKVRSLLNAKFSMGIHGIEWVGDDDSGKSLPSGIYFCRLKVGSSVHTRKMTLVK